MEMRMMRKDDEMNMIKAKKHHHIHHPHQKSQTLPPSPTHSFSSSSSSDFEFTISLSPRKSSNTLCPADELFYRGQLLPLHLSPRLSMVRTLLLPSSTSSSYNCSSSETTTSRDSTASSSNESCDSTSSFASDLGLLADQSCGSSRPSSVAEDTNDESFKRFGSSSSKYAVQHTASNNDAVSRKKYFSLSRFSSVFKKEPKVQKDNNVPDHQQQNNNNMVGPGSNNASSAKPKRMSLTAKEVFSKYLKKVKPLYEKLSQKQQQKMGGVGGGGLSINTTTKTSAEKCATRNNNNKDCGGSSHGLVSQSFSGNLRYPRRRGSVSSCPSSMRCSPSHSGVLSRTTGLTGSGSGLGTSGGNSSASSMEELQSAIQGAIAHCKNSLVVQSKSAAACHGQ
ncbi:hypothetical protein CerSpe_016300 [Prunus speciosa]